MSTRDRSSDVLDSVDFTDDNALLEFFHLSVSSHNIAEAETIRKLTLNPLSPHDALKHLFTSLKTDLIFLQPSVLKQKFS